MLKAGDLARREDHRVRGVKSGRTRQDRGISHVCASVICIHGPPPHTGMGGDNVFSLVRTLV